MIPHTPVWRHVLLIVLIGSVLGCAQKDPLDRPLQTATSNEFQNARAGLAGDLTPEQMQQFDVAIQELKLDAIAQGAAGTELREKQVRALINGKTAREVLVLGWQARHSRLSRELADMNTRYAHDSKLATKPGSTDSARFLSNVKRNEEDIISQLKGQLAETDERLSGWGIKPTQVGLAK